MLKFWQLIKTYWWIIPIIIISILCLIFFRKSGILEKLLKITKDSFEQQLVEMQRLQEEERKRKEELQMKYDVTIKQLEEKYKEQNKELDEAKKKKIKELIETKTIDELNEMLKEEFDL